MKSLRPDITKLLHAGLSDRAIGRQLRCTPRAVSRTRTVLGLPQVKPGPPPPAPAEERFWAHTEPVEGGHLRWTGDHYQGLPCLRGVGRNRGRRSAYRIAFKIRTGRDAKGNALPACNYPRCVAPRHVADAVERARDREALAAILGAA